MVKVKQYNIEDCSVHWLGVSSQEEAQDEEQDRFSLFFVSSQMNSKRLQVTCSFLEDDSTSATVHENRRSTWHLSITCI